MAVTLRWFGDNFKNVTARQLAKGLTVAAAELQRIAKVMTSVPNTGVSVPVVRKTKGGNKRTRTTYPHPSKPGESVRRRTGFGQKNIVFGFNKQVMQSRTGYTRNARYMTYHELGIHYRRVGLQIRPTLVPAVRRNWQRISMMASNAARMTK